MCEFTGESWLTQMNMYTGKSGLIDECGTSFSRLSDVFIPVESWLCDEYTGALRIHEIVGYAYE
jgi:hypothetical protein